MSKTRRARWVDLPFDLLETVKDRLPAREDRDPASPLFGAGVTGDRLRTAIGRACRDAGVPTFSPHALRHRRISLLHRQGESWAAIGERMGQRSKLVTADTYTHALIDSRDVDRGKASRPMQLTHPEVVVELVGPEAFRGQPPKARPTVDSLGWFRART